MILISVLLPAPFSPSRACTSPVRTSKSTSSRATTPGKALRMPCISSTGTETADSAVTSLCRASESISVLPQGAAAASVEQDGDEDDQPVDRQLPARIDAQQDDAVVEGAQQQHRQQRADQRALASGQTDAAQQNGADHLQLEAEPGVVLAGVEARDEDEGADRGQYAGEDKAQRLHAFDPHAG